jgi:hypothetical protein
VSIGPPCVTPLIDIQVTTSLREFLQLLKISDTRITKLCEDLELFTSNLQAVRKTLDGCQALDFSRVERDLWQQSELAIADCVLTLGQLRDLVERIKQTIPSNAIIRRIRRAVDLSNHGAELEAFQDKIHKSTTALHTILQTINV